MFTAPNHCYSLVLECFQHSPKENLHALLALPIPTSALGKHWSTSCLAISEWTQIWRGLCVWLLLLSILLPRCFCTVAGIRPSFGTILHCMCHFCSPVDEHLGRCHFGAIVSASLGRKRNWVSEKHAFITGVVSGIRLTLGCWLLVDSLVQANAYLAPSVYPALVQS